MISLVLGQPAVYAYVTGGLLILFGLIKIGHRVLDLLRDLDDYRANRPRR